LTNQTPDFKDEEVSPSRGGWWQYAAGALLLVGIVVALHLFGIIGG